VAGKTTLRQTAAVLKYCKLFIGNDTGPMHLASAVGVPVIEISAHPRDGSLSHHNSPYRFGPWGIPAIGLQPKTARPPCQGACTAQEAHCIRNVSVDQVKKTILKLWSEPARGK
jgi:lipopolysaccharide heptosyltransferase II